MENKDKLRLEEVFDQFLHGGLERISFGNPTERDTVQKVKCRPVFLRGEIVFQVEEFRGKQVFHKNLTKNEACTYLAELLDKFFRQCELMTDGEWAQILVSKKGTVTIKRKPTEGQKAVKIRANADAETGKDLSSRLLHNRAKRYVLEEGTAVPFLVDLGVMTREGKVVKAKYDKFRQINRFLEFIEDILPTLSKERTVHIIDFGCGKSYLTFAMYYYLHDLQGYDVEITGLDLKEDVIERCNDLSRKYGYEKLRFLKGDIAEYNEAGQVDMVVTLHACDMATDYALAKAVKWGAKVILSVPCCQHEVNKQIHNEELAVLFKHGIVKERVSALITDAIRAELLEAEGYEAAVLEFIDMEHTPKNLLIRAVKKPGSDKKGQTKARQRVEELAGFLGIDPALKRLL